MFNYKKILANRKAVIVVLIVVLLIASVVYFLTKRGGVDKSNQSQVSIPVSEPKITNYFNQTLPIKLGLSETDFSFPTKLPLLEPEATTPLSETEINKIAANLDFKNKPNIIKDIDNGNVYYWNNKNFSLMVTPKISSIVYSFSTNPTNSIKNATNKQLSENSMAKVAEDFLINKINLPAKSIKYVNIFYLKTDPETEVFPQTTQESAEIYQLNFVPTTSDYPILTLDPDQSLISVSVLKDGSILSSNINLQTSLTKGPTEYSLKTFEEFQKNSAKAILINLTGVNVLSLKPSSLKDITVNKVELVYLLDNPKSEYLQPVFLLKGEATLEGNPQKVSAYLYLPALSGQP